MKIDLGGKIKKLRKEKDISIGQLADAIGVDDSTIGHYEINRRRPNYEILRKIASFFEVTIDFLLED